MQPNLKPLKRVPLHPKNGMGIDAPMALIEQIPERPEPLMELANSHVISAGQFDRQSTVQLCRLAAHYETTPVQTQVPLTGKILITFFSEPSTRTRLSFESAWHRLGGDVMPITDVNSTGIAKGESHADVAEMFNHYGDVIVMRNSSKKAIYEMLEALQIPIVNAGNGVDEHPTQALADIYTILKWRPSLVKPNLKPEERVRIGIIGVPARMRTVRSLLLFLSMFDTSISEVVILTDDADPFSPGQKEELESAGLNVRVEADLDKELPNLDVVYINSIAWVGDSFERLGEKLQLSKQSPLKPGSIVMHPLARGPELDTSLDFTHHNWYFAQARGAVFMRMALLTCLVRPIRCQDGQFQESF